MTNSRIPLGCVRMPLSCSTRYFFFPNSIGSATFSSPPLATSSAHILRRTGTVRAFSSRVSYLFVSSSTSSRSFARQNSTSALVLASLLSPSFAVQYATHVCALCVCVWQVELMGQAQQSQRASRVSEHEKTASADGKRQACARASAEARPHDRRPRSASSVLGTLARR